VLGDMLELGPQSRELHAKVGKAAIELALDLVLAVGPEMTALADALDAHFLRGGRGAVWRLRDSGEAARVLTDEARAGDVVLVKGSHGMQMNRVIDALKARHGAEPAFVLRPTIREHPVGDPLPEFIGPRKTVA
jgi:UDP-N-acetylmuramoyl-tripeptide--D-alanyl-D-alanine ligase